MFHVKVVIEDVGDKVVLDPSRARLVGINFKIWEASELSDAIAFAKKVVNMAGKMKRSKTK